MRVFAALLLTALTCQASSLNLAWDPSPDPAVTNYVIYAGTNGVSCTNYTVKVEVGTNLTCRVYDLKPATWSFTCTAMTAHRVESSESNIVVAEVPLPPDKMRTVVLQYSGTITNGFTDAVFFKLRLP